MNILHIAADNIRGGSALSLNILHRALSEDGQTSRLLLGRTAGTAADTRTFPPLTLAGRISYHGVNLLGLNYVGLPGTGRIAAHPFFQAADVVHYHNIHGGYFNYLAFPKLTRLKPSVWTLRDMWGLTGHCAHSFDCRRWRHGCGRCPYPRTDPPIRLDATRLAWRLKRWTYRHSRLTVTAPSQWLAELARQSILGQVHPVRHIPNAVDTTVYKPADRRALRAMLGWPPDATVLLFASDTLANPFKHFELLIEALRQIQSSRRDGLVLAMLGENDWPGEIPAGMRLLPLGYHGDDEQKACFYAAADLFVYPTRADNQPRVLLEAMACGCPCVSVAVGGVPELVRPMETGYLARAGDAASLRHGIETLAGDAEMRSRMSRAGRRLIEAEHGIDVQVKRMMDVYRETIAGRGKTIDHRP